MMRWVYCLICFFISSFVVQGQKASFLQKEIKIPEQSYSLQEIFDLLEEQGILTAYNSNSLQLETKIKLPFEKCKIVQLLNFLEKNHAIDCKLKENKIIFTKEVRRYTICGFVKEKGSGETLVGATLAQGTDYGTFSNAYGFYSLTLPEGDYELVISYIGYISQNKSIHLNKDTQLNINLLSSSKQLSEIVITPQKIRTFQKGFSRINLEKNNTSPTFLGSDDALKRLQIIPGTGGGITGFSELSVRGGNNHENLVLLDDVPVYNYNHFPGILSIFNTEALKSIDFYKGLFPARYGGRLSSVTDIKMREGNMETYHIGGSIDLATLSLVVEGPIVKNKASFIISGRRSWIDALTHLTNEDESFDYRLNDINLKMNYLLNPNNRIYLSFYKGADLFGNAKDEETERLSWSNQITALRWNHTFSDKIFCNTLLAFSKFDNTGNSEKEQAGKLQNITNKYLLREWTLSSDIEYFGEFYQLRFGSSLQKNAFKIPLISNTSNSERTTAFQWKSYVENKVKFTPKIHGNIGLNYVLYQNTKRNKHFFQPRINFNYQLSETSFFSLGFSEMYQFIHQLGSNSINLPYAFRLPASETLSPATSRLYELKYSALLRKEKDTFSASAYFKRQKNILRYKPGQDLFNEQLAVGWEDQVLKGERKTFGVELAYYADFSPLTLNASYAFSNNKERFTKINQNQFYPNALTPKHILILTAEYTFNKKHSVSALGEFNTGRYLNIPLYRIGNIDDVISGMESDSYTYVQNNMNGFQMHENYHIDLGYTFQTNDRKYGKHIVKFGIYSLLGNLAPFRATTEIFENKFTIEEVSLPSPMPYVSYTFKF